MTNPPPCDVSIVIVNWNTQELLRQCLQSVYAGTHAVTFEAIVVDNCSDDGSVAMVEREFPRVRLIANPDNRGFAAANNQAMALAVGRYVLLLNSDTIVLDRAIEKTVAFADAHRDAGVIGCRVLNPDRSLQHSCFMFPSLLNLALSATYLYRLFPRSRFFGREQMSWWDRSDAREVEVVTGCYMLVRREAIEAVGPMDERYFMYFDETDWCYRFKAHGWTRRFTPDAAIVHIGGGSAPKLSARRARVKNRSFLTYIFTHWSRPRALAGVCLMALFYAVRLPAIAAGRALARDDRYDAVVANHWAGLKDILGLPL